MRDAVGRVLRIAVAHGYRIRLIALHRAILAQVAGPCSGESHALSAEEVPVGAGTHAGLILVSEVCRHR